MSGCSLCEKFGPPVEKVQVPVLMDGGKFGHVMLPKTVYDKWIMIMKRSKNFHKVKKNQKWRKRIK